jgi:hypothetical protein
MMPQEACYFLTCDCQCHGPIRPAALQARQERRAEPDITCWGLERGTTANGIANLAWLAVFLGAVVFVIVMAVSK